MIFNKKELLIFAKDNRLLIKTLFIQYIIYLNNLNFYCHRVFFIEYY